MCGKYKQAEKDARSGKCEKANQVVKNKCQDVKEEEKGKSVKMEKSRELQLLVSLLYWFKR